MYVRVYSPSGEMFEVTRDRADQLILEQGWTQTPPTITKEKAPEQAVPKESFAQIAQRLSPKVKVTKTKRPSRSEISQQKLESEGSD